MSQILRAAESSYSVLRNVGWQVHLFEEQNQCWSAFENKIKLRRARNLKKAGVIEHLHDEITGITQRDLFLSMANRIEPFSAINIEPLFQRKITYSALISVDSFPLPA